MKKLTIAQQFEIFHAKHPEVYAEFKRRVQQLWDKGTRHYSADGILHILRWHSIVDGRPDEDRKINNNYSSMYARLYGVEFPQRAAFFATRALKSASMPH